MTCKIKSYLWLCQRKKKPKGLLANVDMFSILFSGFLAVLAKSWPDYSSIMEGTTVLHYGKDLLKCLAIESQSLGQTCKILYFQINDGEETLSCIAGEDNYLKFRASWLKLISSFPWDFVSVFFFFGSSSSMNSFLWCLFL